MAQYREHSIGQILALRSLQSDSQQMETIEGRGGGGNETEEWGTGKGKRGRYADKSV